MKFLEKFPEVAHYKKRREKITSFATYMGSVLSIKILGTQAATHNE